MAQTGNKRIAGLISAAGLSSRMGSFKPLLPCGGSSIIGRCADNMRRAGAEPIVIITGHRGAELESREELAHCVFLHNPRYAETEMFDSLCMGLRLLEGRCDAVLISPADVPAVKPETVAALIGTEGGFVRPVYRGRAGHPVLLKAELIPAILSHSGEGGLRGALEALGVKAADMFTEDEGVSVDADTPEDYQRILRMIERK